ncbi:RDD family protein [Bacillus sp. Marseille-P3661]|uniref:RDD family protein n=1 Tax=Bacillus sp. Marseille-P3661 TaxID=1936234 RepID=UPI0021555096|nr:RDD family protein [Bacillus sp. Marseille-P3661]
MERPNDEKIIETGKLNGFEQHDSKPPLVSTSKENRKYVWFGGFWIRFWAYMIDLIVVGSLNRIIIDLPLRWTGFSVDDSSMLSTIGISTAVMMYLYFILLTKRFGQTLGKMVFGLKVIQKDEQQLSWSAVFFREFIGKFISKTALFLGFIMIGFSPKKQGLHDWFADTIVIQEKKGMFLSNIKAS